MFPEKTIKFKALSRGDLENIGGICDLRDADTEAVFKNVAVY